MAYLVFWLVDLKLVDYVYTISELILKKAVHFCVVYAKKDAML